MARRGTPRPEFGKAPPPSPGGAGGLIPVPEIAGLLSDPERNMDSIAKTAFEGLSPNTLRSYSKSWDDFAAFLRVSSRAEALVVLLRCRAGQANAVLLKYRGELQTRGLAPSTINSRMAAVKSMVDRLRIMGLVDWSLEVKGFKVAAYKDTSGPGLGKIAEVADSLRGSDRPKDVRDLAMLHLFYTCALRRNELASLDLEHLDLEKDRIWVLGKGRAEREPDTVPPKAKEALKRWLEVRLRLFPPVAGEPVPVFVGLDPGASGDRITGDGIYKIVSKYGLGRPHGLRHTSITETLKKTKDPVKAQQHSRHKDVRTVLRYNDNIKDEGGEISRLLDQDL